MSPATSHRTSNSPIPSDTTAGSSVDGVLTIGIDAAEAEGHATGVGRYTIEIVQRWIEEGRNDRHYVIFARRRNALPEALRLGAEVITSEADLGVVRWQQLRLPGLLRKRPVDVLFAPAYAIPLFTRTPAAVALHDLSFERFPEEFRFKERWRRRALARLSARRAARVLTISEFSAIELRRLYRLPADRISIGYPGVDRRRFRPVTSPKSTNSQSTGTSSASSARPFFLAVGTFLRRRHLDVLIRAFAKLPEPFDDHELVLVGKDRAQPPLHLPKLAERLGIADRVRLVDHVEDDELVNLYRTTDLHVSLSAYEGFGLPAAEGLAAGAPTLLLDQPVYRELWADCAHFVGAAEDGPPDAAQVARSMEKACCSTIDQQEVDERLGTHFDWDVCAQAVDAALERAAIADGARA